MAQAQFNPSTLKAAFDPLTGKAIALYKPCSRCSPKPTPEFIRFTIEGLTYCVPFGGCCSGDGGKSKIMGEGIGWNGTMVLRQGRTAWYWEGPGIDDIVFYRWTENPCWWSAFEFGDFGQIYVYADEGCSGGIVEIGNIIAKEYSVYISDHTWYVNIHLSVQLPSGYIEEWHVFQNIYSTGYPWEDCVPYGEEINNEYVCPATGTLCVGEGTVILTEV